jgi:hypothetical protein
MAGMSPRLGILLLAAAMLVVGCRGSNDPGEPTGGTSVNPEAELATFTTFVRDAGEGVTIRLAGVSCDGLRGPYLVTIAVRGNLTGRTIAALPIHAGSTAGLLDWSAEVTGARTGTMSGRYHAKLSGLTGPATVALRGRTTLESQAGVRSHHSAARQVPVELDTGACPNP